MRKVRRMIRDGEVFASNIFCDRVRRMKRLMVGKLFSLRQDRLWLGFATLGNGRFDLLAGCLELLFGAK